MPGEESSCPLSAAIAAASQQGSSSAAQISYCAATDLLQHFSTPPPKLTAQSIYKLNALLKFQTKIAFPTEKKTLMFLLTVCFSLVPWNLTC